MTQIFGVNAKPSRIRIVAKDLNQISGCRNQNLCLIFDELFGHNWKNLENT